MVATKLSLVDYLSFEDGPEALCEFVDGEIIEMPPESEGNVLVAGYLMAQFLKVLPFNRVRRNETEMIVAGRARLPDLMIIGEDLVTALAGRRRSTITEEMPAPLLVVEVVSPGKENEDRDYRYKRSEYAARGIPEYWIVDPAKAVVTVLKLVDGWYEAEELGVDGVLQSPQFAGVTLSVAQVLSPKR
ncbi:Uma2 family endonuclease [Leptolyngbya sp. PCC 6406]|uniref:Uma2 family endonuclease n=1 Tax=Leptolyngbya sp. PCC 6406 TaxID=1173264 RepID=UPI0002ACBBCC|nr:Uma2 family endonuclease [Leptolyngbya sp. PCC 6406]